jgi:hypothetical protein
MPIAILAVAIAQIANKKATDCPGSRTDQSAASTTGDTANRSTGNGANAEVFFGRCTSGDCHQCNQAKSNFTHLKSLQFTGCE